MKRIFVLQFVLLTYSIIVSCAPHGLCFHSSCFDQFYDNLGQNCSVSHFYPAKMSCHESNNSYGMCDGFGKCEIDSNYSCPTSCQRNIIVGCHNYTLNDTNPCTPDNLCRYNITLMDCLDELVCLPQNNNTMRNITNRLNIRVHECLNLEYGSPLETDRPVLSSICKTSDLVLIENTPKKISTGIGKDEPTFLEFFHGNPADNSSDNYPGMDGKYTRVCLSRWQHPVSHPYCSYMICGPQLGQLSIINVDNTSGDCARGIPCTMEMRKLDIWFNDSDPIINNNTDDNNNPPPKNDTDNSSDGSVLSSAWKFILPLIIVSLLLN